MRKRATAASPGVGPTGFEAPPVAAAAAMESFSSSYAGANGQLDTELAHYARWITSHASISVNCEEKLTALSKRSAAELRRAERERGELGRRIEALEEFCHRSFASRNAFAGEPREADVAEAVQHLHQRLEHELAGVKEALGQACAEADVARAVQEQRTSALEHAWAARASTDREGLEELRAWRRQAEAQLSAALREVCDSRARLSGAAGTEAVVMLPAAAAAPKVAEVNRGASSAYDTWLKAEVAQLGAHVAAQLEERLAIVEAELAKLSAEFASQLSDSFRTLEAACAMSMPSAARSSQGQSAAAARRDILAERTAQGEHWEDDGESVRSSLQELRDHVRREGARILDFARDEIRIVHHEVMSLDTRLAALEERGRAGDGWTGSGRARPRESARSPHRSSSGWADA